MMAFTVLQDSRVRVHGGAGLKQLFDDKAGHHGGGPAAALGPRHCQLFNRTVAVLELRNTCLDDSLKLTGVQVFRWRHWRSLQPLT